MAESGCHLNGGTLEKHLRQLSDEKRRAYVMRHKNSIHEKIAEAARNGNKPLLKLLLDQFSPVERSKILRKQCKNGKLPIHHCLCAETDNHMESLKYLLSCVPKTQLYDLLTTFSSMFYNALHMAATYHNARAATILIAALPSERRFNFISQVAGQNKRTVLEFDIKEEFRTKVQQFLLPETPESHEIFSSSPSSDISADNYISWPATLEGPEVVLGYCEECHPHRHTEVNRRRRAKGQRQVPMHPRMTCDDASRLLFVDCVSALLHIDKFLEFVRLSKSIKMLLDCKNVRGLTILHIVAKDDRVDIMEKIFSAIHSFSNEMKWNLLTSTSRSGKTPLHYAAQYNRFNALKLLLFHAKDRDIELCQTHDGAGHDAMYYAGKDVRCFLEYVETHYWHTFSKPPTVLIFYNTFKGEPEWERGWAEDEKDHVVEGFKTHGIQPYTYPDFDGCMIIKEVRKIQNADEPISAMIVLVMSHGEEGIVFDKNKKQLPINALQHALDTSELKCVPKVLMIQACRTRANQTAPRYNQNKRRLADPKPPPESSRPSAPDSTAALIPEVKKHECPHMCTIYPTLVGELAYQDYFLKKFSEVLREKLSDPPEDLISIITKVSRRMKATKPIVMTSFDRRLVFRDPLTRLSIFQRIQQTLQVVWSR